MQTKKISHNCRLELEIQCAAPEVANIRAESAEKLISSKRETIGTAGIGEKGYITALMLLKEFNDLVP